MGKAQGADKEQRLGQVKAKLTTGQGFQSRRAGGEQRGKGHRRGFAQPLHPVQQILVMIKAHHKSRAKSYLCYLLLLWDLVSEPQFTNLQNGSHNKLLDDTRRGLPWVLSLKVTHLLGCDTPLLTRYWSSISTATKPEMKAVKRFCLTANLCPALRRKLYKEATFLYVSPLPPPFGLAPTVQYKSRTDFMSRVQERRLWHFLGCWVHSLMSYNSRSTCTCIIFLINRPFLKQF